MSRAVPAFVETKFGSKRNRFCVAVFVINEGERLLKQLARMEKFADEVDIIVADGGSTDGSVAWGSMKALGVNTLLVKTDAGKLGAQMRMAFSWALDRGYEGIVTIDGNNKDDPDGLPNFLRLLDQGFDHLQGSRFIKNGHAKNTPLLRLIGVRAVHAPLIRLVSGFHYTDTTNGFRGYSRRLLLDKRVAPFRDVFAGYELHYYLAIRAAELGFRIKEVPVSRVYPEKGPVPTKISSVRGNLEVLMKLCCACLHRYDPNSENLE